MLTGLLEPTRGEVLFDGQNIRRDLAGYRKRLGYVPEEPLLYSYLSGQEYLELVGTLRGMPRKQLSQKTSALLQFFSLHSHRHSTLASYSKGMRQRILLIAALLDNPDIFILDEPLSGLDVASALIIKHLIRTLGEHGKVVFYCSHVLEVVEKVCSHILILRKGNVIAQGPTDKVRETADRSLEDTFLQLVDEVDTARVAHDIFEVMSAA
jgi:ABC-2 type transport system ATP-binding protein